MRRSKEDLCQTTRENCEQREIRFFKKKRNFKSNRESKIKPVKRLVHALRLVDKDDVTGDAIDDYETPRRRPKTA